MHFRSQRIVSPKRDSFPNRKICLVLILLFLSSGISLFAQEKISGTISRRDGLPISGVTVVVQGTDRKTLSADDGSFSINANEGDTIVFSHIGYNRRVIRIGNETNLNISLWEAFINLDEVVVTGYISQRVKEITGSVAVVRAKDLVATPTGQIEQMLQGRVAGLTVITSGEPGSPSDVRLHGIGNFGDVTPLYIIDGVEGNLNSLNPYDIESLQVLKDAGAYSIYGVRGANGVIIITTKKGKNGRSRVTYDFYLGTTRPLKKGLDLLTPQENADLVWLAKKNSHNVGANGNPDDALYGNGPVPVLPDYLYAGPYIKLFDGDPLVDPGLYNIEPTREIYPIVRFNKKGTDWFHAGFKPAISQDHSISLSGANNKNHYLFSFGYLDQQGTLINTYLRKFTARVNTEFALMHNIRVGENIQYTYLRNPRNTAYPIDQFLRADLYLPVYDIMGNGTTALGDVPRGPATNPVTFQQLSKNDRDNTWQVFGNAFGEIDLLKGLTFKSSFGLSMNNFYSYDFSYGSYDPAGIPNRFSERSGYSRSWTWTNMISYSAQIANKHHIKALAGTEEKSNYSREMGANRTGYFISDPNYRFLSTGDPRRQSNYSFGSTSYLSSFISQVNYDFKEKYFASGTLRRDASSIFSPANRFGWFPSIGVAWRMTEEKFIKIPWLTELKLRASWGKTGFYGNTDPFNQFTLFGGGPASSYYDINGTNDGIEQGFRMIRIGNAATGWQEDIVSNLGFESILWNGKLSVTADCFIKKSKGLLYPLTLPSLLGDVTPPNVNVGNVRNTGLDLLVATKGNFSTSWSWDAQLTFSHYKNKVVKLNNLNYFDAFGAYNGTLVRNEIGFPISSFYGYKVIGLFKDAAEVAGAAEQPDAAPGRFRYADVNGRDAEDKLTGRPDGKIDDDDRVHFGNPSPQFTMGLNLVVQFKDFDFSTFFYGSFGNDALNDYKNVLNIFSVIPNSPKSKAALYNSWTPQHPDTGVPIIEEELNFSNGAVPNSYRLENGSYFRNKSMILGYSFRKNWLDRIQFERFRIYLQVVNLFTITKYSGLDPELSSMNSRYAGNMPGTSTVFGVDYFGTYPTNQKQWIIGFTMSF